MSKKPKRSKTPMMPPVPRDHDDASYSELMPFKSSKINLKKSPLLLFAVITALIVPYMFSLMGADAMTNDINQKVGYFKITAIIGVALLLLTVLIGFFSYARTDKPLWVFGIGFLIVAIITATPMLFTILAFPFRSTVPGIMDMAMQPKSFFQAFFSMLMVAGFTEEWIKAIPILFGAWLTHQVANGKAADTGFTSKFRIRGPLDGVVMGLFTGAGFIMSETAFDYIPRTFNEAFQQSGSFDAGVAVALKLLMARVFGGITGHMGYSAIFGYFIGLAVIRPKVRWKLLGIGFLSASVIHALWNSVTQISPMLWYVVAMAASVGAVACLLKARQMSIAVGGPAPDTFGSIIVDRPRPKPLPPAPPPPPTYAPPPPTFAPPPPVATELPLALEVEGLMIPLRGGGTIDLGAEPALGGRGTGILGAIVPHPTRANVLGLRNGGGTAWTARLRDGSQQVIERDQNIRLAPGVQIEFGNTLSGRVVTVG